MRSNCTGRKFWCFSFLNFDSFAKSSSFLFHDPNYTELLRPNETSSSLQALECETRFLAGIKHSPTVCKYIELGKHIHKIMFTVLICETLLVTNNCDFLHRELAKHKWKKWYKPELVPVLLTTVPTTDHFLYIRLLKTSKQSWPKSFQAWPEPKRRFFS